MGTLKTSDFIEFEKAVFTAQKLLQSPKTEILGRYITIAIYTGLRNSDIIRLTFEDLQSDKVTITEVKTGKTKTIAIHSAIRAIIPADSTGDMFLTNKGSNITIQHLNRELKKVFSKESKTLNISSHSLRKSFGRHVYNTYNQSEQSLLYLMELFNHSSLTMTKKYLGIRQEELNNIYLSL